MGRLFDSGSEEKAAVEAREKRDGVRRRAEEIEKLLQDELELDKAGAELGQKLAQTKAMGVQAVQYKAYRQTGSKWMIEHAVVGDDYIYQAFPLRPIQADWRDTIVLLLAAMDAVFPRSMQIKYTPPNEVYKIKCFTIRVEKVVGKPGWEEACGDRALKALAGVQAWT
jgi:hypothetical protein